MKENILIVGTGALGCLFAARLARVGHPVTMLGTWKEGLEALRGNGVRLLDSDREEHHFPVLVTDEPRECRGVRQALVLVMSWQTERAARQLAECLAVDGLAVTLQNGLGNRETLIQSLGPGRVALGVTTTGATLLGPGLVKAGGEGPISIERSPALGPLEEALRSANFNVQIVEEAQALIWGKLVINSAINPLTALLRMPNGELLERTPEHSRWRSSLISMSTSKIFWIETGLMFFSTAAVKASSTTSWVRFRSWMGSPSFILTCAILPAIFWRSAIRSIICRSILVISALRASMGIAYSTGTGGIKKLAPPSHNTYAASVSTI